MAVRSSEEIRLKAIELYESGFSAIHVGQELGFNESTIRSWLRKYKVEIRNGGSYNIKYPEKSIEDIIRLYSKGMYTSEIDILLGFRKGTAQYILNKRNVSLRHRGPKSMIGNEDFFDVIDDECKAYFLGYIMADGNVSITNNQFCLKLHISIQDKEIIDKFLKVINSSNKTSIKNNGKSYYVSLTSVHMCKRLIELGVIPNKTGKECISDEIPKSLIRHYLRGVFDGDGITDISKKRSGFVGSVNIINSILKELDEELTVFYAGKGKKVVYFLGGKKFSKKLHKYLYDESNIWLERKRSRLEYIFS